MAKERAKFIIRCRRCGERFTLRGSREKGTSGTGFKQCICENAEDFDIKIENT